MSHTVGTAELFSGSLLVTPLNTSCHHAGFYFNLVLGFNYCLMKELINERLADFSPWIVKACGFNVLCKDLTVLFLLHE